MNKLMNVTIKSNKIDIVSFLKGFSIITIVLMHLIQDYITKLPSFIKLAASMGGTGVHVFFLCSGLGLYLSYLNHKTTFAEFIKKRFTKIYIPYIMVILISFCLPWMYEDFNRFEALLSHIFLYKMFSTKYIQSFGNQFWFVSTIIQFYLLFIPLCLIKQKINNNKHFLLLALTMSATWWIFLYLIGLNDERIWGSFCLQYIWEFALGMVIAEYMKTHKKIVLNKFILLILAFVGLSLQAILATKADIFKVFNDIPALFGYLSLTLLFYNISIIKKTVMYISAFSYELYLTHILIMSTIFHFFDTTSLTIQIQIGLCSFALCLVFSFLYYKILKKYIYKK